QRLSTATELGERDGSNVRHLFEFRLDDAVVIAPEKMRMRDAGSNPSIEGTCAPVSRNGCIQQPAVTTGAHEPCKELGVGGPGALNEAHHCILGSPEIDFELRLQLVEIGRAHV